MSNIGLVIALAARARQFPDEFDLVRLIQDSAMYDPTGNVTMYANAIKWSLDGWMVDAAHLASTFGLRFLGARTRNHPHGYVRLPSSQNDRQWMYKREQLYLARYVPDLREIAKWAVSSE